LSHTFYGHVRSFPFTEAAYVGQVWLLSARFQIGFLHFSRDEFVQARWEAMMNSFDKVGMPVIDVNILGPVLALIIRN
jgi:hypothetical protein